jgi:hypothetical protein
MGSSTHEVSVKAAVRCILLVCTLMTVVTMGWAQTPMAQHAAGPVNCGPGDRG